MDFGPFPGLVEFDNAWVLCARRPGDRVPVDQEHLGGAGRGRFL